MGYDNIKKGFNTRLPYLKASINEARWTLAFIACIVVVPLLCVWITPNTGKAWSIAGGILQGLGVGIVIYLITQIRKWYKLERVRTLIWDWLKALRWIIFSKPKVDYTVTVDTGEMEMKMGKVDVSTESYPQESDSKEEIARKTSKLLRKQRERISKVEKRVTTMGRSLTDKINVVVEAERTEREASEEQQKELMIGNHTEEILGVLLVLFGIIYSTIGAGMS